MYFSRSEDGGKSFERYRTLCGDHHDLWIDPKDNSRLIVGDDVSVSNDAAFKLVHAYESTYSSIL